MRTLAGLDTAVDINLEHGIYNFSNYSSTGKTRLAKVISEYEIKDKKVIAITYNDILRFGEEAVLDRIKPGKHDLLVLDRYDMYSGFAKDKINKFSETGIVLIDCKSFSDGADGVAVIWMTPSKIEVY